MVKKLVLCVRIFCGYGILTIKKIVSSKPPITSQPQRLLILGYAAIGDLIFFLPSLRALRQEYPKAHITFIVNKHAGTEELLPATGLVNEIWFYEHSDLATSKTRGEIAGRIRNGNFDAVIVSQPTPIRPFASALFCIPIRIGHCRPLTAPHAGWSAVRYALWRLRRGVISEEFERRLVLNQKIWVSENNEHQVLRNLRLISALGISASTDWQQRPPLPESKDVLGFAERALEDTVGAKIVGLHIGSPESQYEKIWSPEQWGSVCQKLSVTYHCRIVLLGGSTEAELLPRFRATFPGPFLDLVGRSQLLETFSAIRRCTLFLGNDTGLTKTAMALGIPTFTVWGPSDRLGYGIFWDPDRHFEMYLPLPCSPCVRMGLRAEGAGVINFSNCGHHNCLTQMTPEIVFSSIQKRYNSLLS